MGFILLLCLGEFISSWVGRYGEVIVLAFGGVGDNFSVSRVWGGNTIVRKGIVGVPGMVGNTVRL